MASHPEKTKYGALLVNGVRGGTRQVITVSRVGPVSYIPERDPAVVYWVGIRIGKDFGREHPLEDGGSRSASGLVPKNGNSFHLEYPAGSLPCGSYWSKERPFHTEKPLYLNGRKGRAAVSRVQFRIGS